MNYFTKEWYKLCQKTDCHLLLEEDKEAKFFSEEYFQQLYKEKLSENLALWESVSKIHEKNKTSEEISNHIEPFDSEKVSKQFYEIFTSRQENIRKNLPEEILNKIADIRVYTLNKASYEVINDVTRFCENNKKIVNKTINDYEEYYNSALKSFDSNIAENINFHDCKIIDIKQNNQSLSILFDNSGGFTDIDEIIFENYKVINQDTILENSWWLYEEIYKTKDKYELHVLLQNQDRKLIDFIISAEHISFNRNK